MTYYEILGIPMDADDRAIRTAFRMLARRFHPDAGAGSSPEKFRRLVEAYATLGDPDFAGARTTMNWAASAVRPRLPLSRCLAGSRAPLGEPRWNRCIRRTTPWARFR
ncbi:MAG: J domain-containing protein [Bryobacteraceae bacterium]|nr:J domain-containing protein [Bryobacteraceae bacterium]